MTQIDPRRSVEDAAMPAIRAALERAGALDENTWVTGAVVVVQTEQEGPSGPRFTTHRLHPCGPLNPALERGLLHDALRDSERRS